MRTIKVRIAVAVDASGEWNACGGTWAKDDKVAMDIAVDPLADGEARYWVETEIALPTSAEPIAVEAVPSQGGDE